MAIYDVKAKQKHIKSYLRKLRNKVRKDEIEGICIIAFKKDKSLEQYQFEGDLSIIEWVGAMETIKTAFIVNLIDDLQED